MKRIAVTEAVTQTLEMTHIRDLDIMILIGQEKGDLSVNFVILGPGVKTRVLLIVFRMAGRFQYRVYICVQSVVESSDSSAG